MDTRGKKNQNTKHMQVNIKTTLAMVAAKFWVLFNVFGLHTLPED